MDKGTEQWIIIMILMALIVGLIAILLTYRFQLEKSPIENEPTQAPKEKQKKENIDSKQKRFFLIILSAIILLSLSLVFWFIISNK